MVKVNLSDPRRVFSSNLVQPCTRTVDIPKVESDDGNVVAAIGEQPSQAGLKVVGPPIHQHGNRASGCRERHRGLSHSGKVRKDRERRLLSERKSFGGVLHHPA